MKFKQKSKFGDLVFTDFTKEELELYKEKYENVPYGDYLWFAEIVEPYGITFVGTGDIVFDALTEAPVFDYEGNYYYFNEYQINSLYDLASRGKSIKLLKVLN